MRLGFPRPQSPVATRRTRGMRQAAAIVGLALFAIAAVSPATIGASPDNGTIVFLATGTSGRPDIFFMNGDGSDRVQVTRTKMYEEDASLSPAADRVAYHGLTRNSDGEIFKIRTYGSRRRNLTKNDVPDAFPSWSPDGERIVFASRRRGPFELFSMRANGKGVKRLTTPPEGADDTEPAWSPDGKRSPSLAAKETRGRCGSCASRAGGSPR